MQPQLSNPTSQVRKDLYLLVWQVAFIPALIAGIVGVVLLSRGSHEISGQLAANGDAIHSNLLTGWGTFLIVTAFIFLGMPVWRFALRYGLDIGEAAGRAVRPLPSPVQIEAELTQHFGRPATFQEVAAMQQMLHTQRNQDLLTAGIGIGAIWAVNHTLHNGGRL